MKRNDLVNREIGLLPQLKIHPHENPSNLDGIVFLDASVVKVISEQIEAVITGSCLSNHCLDQDDPILFKTWYISHIPCMANSIGKNDDKSWGSKSWDDPSLCRAHKSRSFFKHTLHHIELDRKNRKRHL